MKDWTEKDVENLIKNSAFQDQAHKDRLRRRLFDVDMQLGLDELELVAGGKRLTGPEEWAPWPVPEEKKP